MWIRKTIYGKIKFQFLNILFLLGESLLEENRFPEVRRLILPMRIDCSKIPDSYSNIGSKRIFDSIQN
ncbi:hypothetical protein DLM75_12250 [Leptospira stimsonii]|uniref:Uncharacterized protein n=1 Tax=Leptospira stimsonii TaxID=2202203 RepID=A0A396Z2K1_9LEPT|nr:hypothetical protein DLM75_12250 [Leptospira stimsonii]